MAFFGMCFSKKSVTISFVKENKAYGDWCTAHNKPSSKTLELEGNKNGPLVLKNNFSVKTMAHSQLLRAFGWSQHTVSTPLSSL